jgi:hypothetical protein
VDPLSLPRFLQPPPRRTDPPQLEEEADPDPWATQPDPATGLYLAGEAQPSAVASTQKQGRVPTRTETSSPAFESTPETAAALVIGLGGIAVGIAAWLVRARLQRRLRRPTEGELGDIATPIGQILHRRWAAVLGKFGPDVADLIKAGAAAGVYVNNGPLTEWDSPDPGIPDNLQEELS